MVLWLPTIYIAFNGKIVQPLIVPTVTIAFSKS